MDYELYHDESQVDGYWHGIFLVPSETKNELVDLLDISRSKINYFAKVSLKNLRRTRGQKYNTVNSWIQIGVASLMQSQKTKSGLKHHIYLGARYRGQPIFDPYNILIKTKFILFRERDYHQLMDGYPDHASKIETTFRMGLKGGIHLLASRSEPINIIKMHFDGHEHYQRNLDRNRIINRLEGLRPYCSISDDNDIIDDRCSDPNHPDSQEYADCQILQLTDLMVGGFRTHFCENPHPSQKFCAQQIQSLIEKYSLGIARMNRSRWKNSFCLSQCYLENSNWQFDTLELNKKSDAVQLELL